MLSRFLFVSLQLQLFLHCSLAKKKWSGFQRHLDQERRYDSWTDAHQIARQGDSFATGGRLWKEFDPLDDASVALDHVVLLFLETASNDFLQWTEQASGRTALHVGIQFNNFPMLRLFCYRNLGLDQPDQKGNTPLHYAAKHGRALHVIWLRVFGADTRIKNSEGLLPIDLAKDDESTKQFLTRELCDILHEALEDDDPFNIKIARAFAQKEHKCISTPNSQGDYPIHLVARVDNDMAYDLLVCVGNVDPFQLNQKRQSAYEIAVAHGEGDEDFDESYYYREGMKVMCDNDFGEETEKCWQPHIYAMDREGCDAKLAQLRKDYGLPSSSREEL